MSFRLEMLQVARLAPNILGEAAELVREHLLRRMNPDGAFAGREGGPDLYYTVFGMEGLLALRTDPPWERLSCWLRTFGQGADLDFIHLCCLVRCWSAMPRGGPVLADEDRAALGERLAAWRTPDGGFHQRAGSPRCTAYGCLLGWAAHLDLRLDPPPLDALASCLDSLRTPDGGYANEPGLPMGTVTATAAAVALHRQLRRTTPGVTGAWLLAQQHPAGGFLAFPAAPLPDLLSTAVALHALDGMQVSYAATRELLMDYVDSLWSAEGGFHGHWADDDLDVEYTYYGLLALGHLAVQG